MLGFKHFVKTAKLDHAKDETMSEKKLENLQIYKQEEVKKHGKDADRIWVTYKDVS